MPKLTKEVYTRLFEEDVLLLKKLADAEGLTWGSKLRTLVHRALKAESLSMIELDPRKRK